MRCRVPAVISIALALEACGPVDALKEGFAHSLLSTPAEGLRHQAVPTLASVHQGHRTLH